MYHRQYSGTKGDSNTKIQILGQKLGTVMPPYKINKEGSMVSTNRKEK